MYCMYVLYGLYVLYVFYVFYVRMYYVPIYACMYVMYVCK